MFSNSLIEGNNRILKQCYLKDKKLTKEELPNYIAESIKEYNYEKPHYPHKIYTPDEIYNYPKLTDTKLFFDKTNSEYRIIKIILVEGFVFKGKNRI